ncbi:MAG: C10 family peptidase, partial [Chitinispirillales bacterium]|nr:C10 family peptidase [Chitinispirillales bacterium]
MKKAMLYASLISVMFLGIILTGCAQITGTESGIEADLVEGVGGGNSAGDHSRRTDLALMRTLQAHQVDISELSQIVLNAFSETMAAPTLARSTADAATGSIIRSREVFSNTKSKFERSERFGRDRRENQSSANNSLGRSANIQEAETVELYEFVVGDGSGDEWFVLASNDVRVGHILAITQGSFEDSDSRLATFLRESLNEYIDAVIYEYNDITDDEAETVLVASFEVGMPDLGFAKGVGPGVPEGSDWVLVRYSSNLQVQRGPLLRTWWGQGIGGYTIDGFAYNNYIKHHFRNDPNGQFYITGCGPTAVAQIIAYHNFINPNAASRTRMAPAFTDATSSTMNMGTWNGQYNLSLIRTMPFIRNNASADAKGQIAALMFHIFREVNATP